MTNLEDKVNCSNRVYYTNKHYCSMDYTTGDCKYLNVMKTDIITALNNIPIYLSQCDYINKLADNWFKED